MQISLRFADLGDLEAVHAIEQRSFARPWPLPAFADCLAPGSLRRIRLLCQGDEILGYALTLELEDDWDLYNLAIKEERRHEGLGRILLRDVLARARQAKAERIFLEYRESNLAARALYEAFGFEKYHRRKDYYEYPTEAAIGMRLDLVP